MLEAIAAIAFWRRKDRRKEYQPVPIERRKMTPAKAHRQVLHSIDRLTQAVEQAKERCDK